MSIAQCNDQSGIGIDKAIQLADQHALMLGVPQSNEITDLLNNVGTIEIDGVGQIDTKVLTDLNPAALAGLTVLIPGVGPIIAPILGVALSFIDFNKDSGCPGTDFQVSNKNGKHLACINSGAWAMIAKDLKKNHPNSFCLSTSKQSGKLLNLEKGYCYLQFNSDELLEKYLPFIAMNVRTCTDVAPEVQLIVDDMHLLKNKFESEGAFNPNQDLYDYDIKGAELLTSDLEKDENKENLLNIGSLALGAFLLFKMIK